MIPWRIHSTYSFPGSQQVLGPIFFLGTFYDIFATSMDVILSVFIYLTCWHLRSKQVQNLTKIYHLFSPKYFSKRFFFFFLCTLHFQISGVISACKKLLKKVKNRQIFYNFLVKIADFKHLTAWDMPKYGFSLTRIFLQ